MTKLNSDSFINFSRTEQISTNLWSVAPIKTNKFALFDANGKQLTDFKYEFIGKYLDLPNNTLLVGEYNKKGLSYGCINQNGEEILPSIYKSIDEIIQTICV